MPKPTVYIETTIPSFLVEIRPDFDYEIRHTRIWWENDRSRFEVFTSAFVMAELAAGSYPTKTNALNAMQGIPLLPVRQDLDGVVAVYLAEKLISSSAVADAYHLAMASGSDMDYLLTWNCRHLANANKIRHITIINGRLGLRTPIICTPAQLIKETEE